jgi:hypothetical protein
METPRFTPHVSGVWKRAKYAAAGRGAVHSGMAMSDRLLQVAGKVRQRRSGSETQHLRELYKGWTYLWDYPFTKIRSGRMATRSAVYTSTPLRSLCPADRLLSNLTYC